MHTATERLWLTADGEQLVRDGDVRAAVLHAAPGDEISAEDVSRIADETEPEKPSPGPEPEKPSPQPQPKPAKAGKVDPPKPAAEAKPEKA